MVYNGTAYGYVHNLQGDIIAIVDSAGTKVVEYKYDPWGKPLSKTGTLASTLGTLNPFRYRGYVYDEETGLYYLRSRYYTCKVARFLNADVLYNVKGSLYRYCKNNPTKHVDTNGYIQSNALPKPWYEDFSNPDGTYSLYDSDRFRDRSSFHEQVLVVKYNLPDFDLNDGDLSLGGAEFELITGGWETEYFDLSLLDIGHAEVACDINMDEFAFSVGAKASVWSPSVSFMIFGCEITLGLEVLAVGVHSDVDMQTSSASAFIGFGIWGISFGADW